ncbi:MAG TPA: PilC/PilY family type IV pilus protein [Steroidobacteraceae bacterium]|nr:PilC/PilY family type IV pilus protein [Steroidobacteraceae bacterium]
MSGTAFAAVPAAIPISQVPLTVAIPAHPQVLFALANSQSVDGDLSGAIVTGSGGLAANLSALQASSSPVNYTVPAGFTAPVSGTTAGNSAPYTVTTAGVEYDNSNSRLNVAKAGIASILQTFLPVADFGLIDYQVSGLGKYATWVYYMSPSGTGFSFTNLPPAGSRYVKNPCFGVTLDAANPVDTDCTSLAGRYGATFNTNQYMLIGSSSDDPSINDVLYANGFPPVFVDYSSSGSGAPNPSSPFTFSLSQYNNNQVSECYNKSVPSIGGICETPTNAGFVPYSNEVMQVERGFGYYASSQSAKPASVTSWPALVPMTTAGQVPTQASINSAIACFSGGTCSSTGTNVPNYLAPETNSTATSEIKAVGLQSPIAGLLQAAGDYYTAKNPPSSNGCTATRYVVLVTDGLPTMDLAGKMWPPLGTASATGYGVTPTSTAAFNADGSLTLSNTNDQALIDTLNTLSSLQAAGVKTYVIGVGAGVDPASNPLAAATLTAMAVAGGTSAYFPATSAQQLNQDMQVILAQILAATQSVASTAVNSTGLHNGAYAYLAQFNTSDTYQDWTGNLTAYPVDISTGQVNMGSPAWSAQGLLDAKAASTRVIGTWDPVAKAGTPFEWNPGLAPDGISSSTTLGTELSTFSGDMNGQDVLNFLRGDTSKEKRNGGAFRNRAHILGDIVSSAPLYVGAPEGFSQVASYQTFKANHKDRAPIIYIGANDGMLHAFDATTGAERFAYIPSGVYANLVNLANPYYNEQHLFYVNGSPRAADVQFSNDNTWHTLLVGGEGAGGKSIYALDVTNDDQITTESQLASAVQWEFTDADMGYTFSEPAIGDTADGWMVFFGNGYDSTNEKPYLYALDARTGSLVTKIDLCAAVASACSGSVANGLSSVTVVNSYGLQSLPADVAYAGDLQGNVWRIDISDANPANWVVTLIFQARDSSGAMQPITTAPGVALNPHYPRVVGDLVFVGTGQLLSVNDLATTGVQTLYGIFDPPRGSPSPLGFAGVPTRSNLVQQVLESATIGAVSVRLITPGMDAMGNPIPAGNPVNIPVDRGWYVDLSLSPGERFVTDPEVAGGGGVVTVTYQPNVSSCTGGGNAWLYLFNDGTGGSFALPQLDVNNDGSINSNDQTASAANPTGMSIGAVYGSQPTIISSASIRVLQIAESNSSIAGVSTSATGNRRIGWFEVRQ